MAVHSSKVSGSPWTTQHYIYNPEHHTLPYFQPRCFLSVYLCLLIIVNFQLQDMQVCITVNGYEPHYMALFLILST
jgi:hypothetical protein